MIWKNKNKITNFFGVALVLALSFCFFGKEANAGYEYEAVSFYAQSSPSAYAVEGTAFWAHTSQKENSLPVYRFFSSRSGDHFYTISSDEKTSLENNSSAGYAYEGAAFWAYTSQVSGTVPVYRFLNSKNSDHFYTASSGEKDALINNPAWGYNYEGVAFFVFPSQVSDTSAVYRFFNASNGDHFYTASSSEKNELNLAPVFRFVNYSSGDHFYTASNAEKSVLANASASGYTYEGIAYYARTSQTSGTTPVYRLFNSSTGDHFYTAGSAEKDSLVSSSSGYAYEGVAFYAYSSQASGTSPVYRFYNSENGDHFYTVSEAEKTALQTSELGPEIAVGLWNYTRSGLKDNPFKISANKTYNIKDSNGNIVGQIGGGTETRVTYDSDSYLKAYGSISSTRSKKVFYFDAADGDNSTMIFDVNRPDSSYDEYRGKIKIQYYDKDNLWVVNTLPLEHYTWGMGETTGTGDFDHTKLMTVIFRTYGYWYIKYATKYNKYGFTIRSDSGSQIYRGYEWEENYTNIKKAAKATRAIIATYDGEVALTPYSSWSAGKTRSYEDYWGSDDYPWCQSVDDPYGDYNADHWDNSTQKSQSTLTDEGNHMVGLIAHGSLYLADEKNWAYDKIMKYYYKGISLNASY